MKNKITYVFLLAAVTIVAVGVVSAHSFFNLKLWSGTHANDTANFTFNGTMINGPGLHNGINVTCFKNFTKLSGGSWLTCGNWKISMIAYPILNVSNSSTLTTLLGVYHYSNVTGKTTLFRILKIGPYATRIICLNPVGPVPIPLAANRAEANVTETSATAMPNIPVGFGYGSCLVIRTNGTGVSGGNQSTSVELIGVTRSFTGRVFPVVANGRALGRYK